MLTRDQALTLAKEVITCKARSYVSAAHALAEFILREEQAARALSAALHAPPDLPTVRTLPHPIAGCRVRITKPCPSLGREGTVYDINRQGAEPEAKVELDGDRAGNWWNFSEVEVIV